MVSGPAVAHALAAQNPDKIRVGVVGCGNRGIGAAMDAVISAPNVEVVALADLFPEKIDAGLKRLRSPQQGRTREAGAQYGSLNIDWDRFDAVRVTPERCFSGFDSYRQILQTDVDVIILAGPPGFRPQHIRAALDAGKHVFAEKPVAVDPAGVRSVLLSTELAGKKHLGFMGGMQLRFSPPYNETIQRVHDGQVGQVISAECYSVGRLFCPLASRAPESRVLGYGVSDTLLAPLRLALWRPPGRKPRAQH